MTINFYDQNFYYSDMAVSIANDIISCIRKGTKEFKCSKLWQYPIKIEDDEEYMSLVDWNFKVVTTDVKRVDIWASAGFSESYLPEISLSIIMPKEAECPIDALNYSELVGVIAHELHHIAQKNEAMYHYQGDSTNPKVRYYLNPAEIPAFHIGFRAQCHISGEDMGLAMRAYLSHQGLTDNETESIVAAWLNPSFEIAAANIIV